jgi:molybdopterin/thiamine biosynthesis adenylyltransferase
MTIEHTDTSNLERLITSHTDTIPEWQQPDQFDLTDNVDRREMERRLTNGRIAVSRLPLFADGMFEMHHPDQENDDKARREYTDEIMNQGINYGLWHDFSWKGTLEQFPLKKDLQDLRTFRNQTLITPDEQAKLLSKTAAVFGLSVGSHVANQLVRGGICGRLVIGDFDTVSPSNLNRMDATVDQIGWKKVDVVATRTSELDPYIEQVHFRDGVTPANLERLAEMKPDILFDEIDNIAMKAMLRAFAKEQGIPLVMATDLGDKSIIDVERHDLGDVKPFNGLLKQAEYDALLAGKPSSNPQKTVIKMVGARNLTMRLVDSVSRVGDTLGGIPQLGTTAAIGGALGAVTAREILVGRRLDSGRSISSIRNTLGLEHQTSVRDGIRVFRNFLAKK